MTVDGATENLDVRLATDKTGRWVGKPDARAPAPALAT